MLCSLKFAAVSAAALLDSSAAADHVGAGESVTISYRWMGAICTGNCPDFQIRVLRSGHVTSVDRSSNRVISFRVEPRQLASFQRELQAVRPTRDLTTHEICPVVWRTALGGDPRENWMKVDEVSVVWSSPNENTNLHACYADRGMKAAVDRALLALLINPHGGNRIPAFLVPHLLCEIRALELEPHPDASRCPVGQS